MGRGEEVFAKNVVRKVSKQKFRKTLFSQFLILGGTPQIRKKFSPKILSAKGEGDSPEINQPKFRQKDGIFGPKHYFSPF